MGIEYFFNDVHTSANKGAFDESAVFIENPHKLCNAELLRKLRCFPQKKMAVEFCKQWNVDFSSIVKMQTRFQYTWVIDLGRNCFVPEFAEGYLLAKSLGKEFSHAEVA